MDKKDILTKEIQMLIELYETLDKMPLSFDRVIYQFQLLELLDSKVPDKPILPKHVIEQIIEIGFKSMTNAIAIYPFSDSEAADKFVNRIMNWEPESRELLLDHLSELKFKQPDLYHPVWDQIIAI